VIDHLQPVAARVAVDAVDEVEIDVVDRFAFLEAIDQVERRAADALDRRQAQLHRPGRQLDRLRAELQRARVGGVRVLDPERQAARGRAVLGGEIGRQAVRLAIDDEVDRALAKERDVLRAVARDLGEAEQREHALERARRRRGELDELESHQAHRVVEEIGHACSRRRNGSKYMPTGSL